MLCIRCLLLLTIFASCRSLRITESAVPVTIFEADSSLLNRIEAPLFTYNDLSGIVPLAFIMELNKEISFLIHKPTLVRCFSSYGIVNPGESIRIKTDQNGEIIFQSKNNGQRTKELAFQHVFQILDQEISPEFPGRSRNYSIDTILAFEQKIKSQIPSYIVRSHSLFDSLAIAYKISDTCKMLSNSILKNRQYTMLYYFYNVYKKELEANNLYTQKLREMLPIYNSITNQKEIDFDGEYYLNSLADNLMRIKIVNIKSEAEIKEAIDSINNNFNNLSRDFLLSKLMYHVIYKRIPLSRNDMEYYRNSCIDNNYKKIVNTVYGERRKYAKKSKIKRDNRLIALSDLKIYTFDKTIAQYKGKLVLIDFWASWCAPCLEQIPLNEKLKQQFSNREIVFLYLSMDREILKWKQKSTNIGIDSKYSYLFENFTKQSFLKDNNVETIPRYILIGQNGKIINADAPHPDDPALKKLIEDHMEKY